MTASASTPILAWHFVPANRKLRYSGDPLVIGKTYVHNGPLELCENGLHACENLLDALGYAPGPILCRVEVSGTIEHGHDKLCASKRKVLWAIDADRLLHRFACTVAARALRKAKVTDKRCWNAIRVKRLWIVGKSTDAELDAAWDAAWDAARDAAWDAARDAAWAAARGAAWDAAWDAERSYQGKLLLRLVKTQAQKEGHKL